MKVLIDGKIHDANDEFIGIIFENDAERMRIAKQINEMEKQKGRRAFMIFPDNLVKNVVNEQIELIRQLK